ncbi:MAG: YggT family protein [Alphaproteobacteria bacterium]
MVPLVNVILIAINIYTWIIIIQAILSWLIAFQVVNSRSEFVNRVSYALYALTEPALRPIRNFLPNLGSVDISPIILLLGLWFLEGVLAKWIVTF